MATSSETTTQKRSRCVHGHLFPEVPLLTPSGRRRCAVCLDTAQQLRKKRRLAKSEALKSALRFEEERWQAKLREKAALVATGMPTLTESQIIRLRNVLGGAR